MKVVVDRIVQYPNRFQLVNVSTGAVLGVFDLSAVTGTIQQVGTEIDAELFQSIQDDLTKLAQDIVAESNARGVDVKALQDSIATKITASGGELGNGVVTFSEVSNATNISSGEKASTLFGKIRNWFSRLKALAFKDTIADADVSSNANISQSKVSGLIEIQNKLNGIDAGANKYTLPVSTATNLGGVKVGSRLSVASDGTLSADSQTENSYTTTEKNKLAGIESGAQKNAVTSVNGKTGALTGFVTDTGMQEFNRGTSGATSKVVINETDWDALVVKNLNDETKKTAISSDYVWIQDNNDKATRINTDGILKFDESHPDGSTAKFPDIPNGATQTLATQEDIPVKSENGALKFGNYTLVNADGGINAERFEGAQLDLFSSGVSGISSSGLQISLNGSELGDADGSIGNINGSMMIPIVAGNGISIATNDSSKAEISSKGMLCITMTTASSVSNYRNLHFQIPNTIGITSEETGQSFTRVLEAISMAYGTGYALIPCTGFFYQSNACHFAEAIEYDNGTCSLMGFKFTNSGTKPTIVLTTTIGSVQCTLMPSK